MGILLKENDGKDDITYLIKVGESVIAGGLYSKVVDKEANWLCALNTRWVAISTRPVLLAYITFRSPIVVTGSY